MILVLPLSMLLIPYGLVVAGVAVFALFNIQHLFHYGATTRTSFIVTFTFLAGFTLILFFTWQQLQGVDWSQTIGIASAASTTLPTL